MVDPIKVGKQIKVLRKNKGLTQVQLADRLKISYQSISKWERGASLPSHPLLVDIAINLETKVELILHDGEKNIQIL